MEDKWCGGNGFGGQWVCENETGGEWSGYWILKKNEGTNRDGCVRIWRMKTWVKWLKDVEW